MTPVALRNGRRRGADALTKRVTISIGSAASPLERFAASELARFLRRLTHLRGVTDEVAAKPPKRDRAGAAWRVVLGTSATNPEIAAQGRDCSPELLGAEGYRIWSGHQLGDTLLMVAGADERGVLYAVYDLLQHLGCSFHLSGDILPERVTAFRLPALNIQSRPLFALRGTQLWGLWYCGRDSWGWPEYRRYIDQLVKLRLNLFDFPLYHAEPLYTDYSFRGQRPEGVRPFGLDTRLARIGRRFFHRRGRFTAPEIPDEVSPAERNRAAIALMQRVFAYARSRGVHVRVGIELQNQVNFGREILATLPAEDRYEDGLLICPSSRSAEELSRARLKALVETYPDCDSYAIWQPEQGPFRTSAGSPHPADVAFRQQHHRHADLLSGADFDYLEWVLLAHRIMAEIKPGARLVMAGWGLERMMRAADEILPPDVVRHTIAWYEPQIAIDRNDLRFYEGLRGPAHYTSWAEFDGHMWMPQVKTTANAQVLDRLQRAGVRGTAILHWRNLATDLDVTFFAQRCWQGDLSAEEHWRRWTNAKYGAESVEPLCNAMRELDALDRFICRADDRITFFRLGSDTFIDPLLQAHRYIDRSAPIPDSWLDECVRRPARLLVDTLPFLERAERVVGETAPAVRGSAQRVRFGYLAQRVRYLRSLFQSHLMVGQAILRLQDGLLARQAGDEEGFQRAAKDSLQGIRRADVEGIVRRFAKRLGERAGDYDPGELGVLLSLNYKFLGGVRRLEGRLLRVLGRRPGRRSNAARRLGVLCGAALPCDPRVAWRPWFGALGVRWTPDADVVVAHPGFAYAPALPLRAQKLTPDVGCWRADDRIEVTLTVPGDFSGFLKLYLHEEVEFDSMVRRQLIRVAGQVVGDYFDFFCRGTYWDEGVWVEVPLSAQRGRTPRNVVVEVVRTGLADVLLSGIELYQGGDCQSSRLDMATRGH